MEEELERCRLDLNAGLIRAETIATQLRARYALDPALPAAQHFG